MSSIYNLEPQPTASVIVHTTQGELSVELFAKQIPLTCRNFLQHSLDGYYKNTIFHRLVPGFILQGGDPTGTGNGGESIYDGGAFAGDLDPWPMDQRRGKNAGPEGIGMRDEFHSRLKFNRRGLLGMANEGSPDTNGSQFFFTLGKAEELTQKNTIFGRISGDTIYNLAKMGEAEVHEGTDRPIYPTKITRVEILVNPFKDMEKRERVAKVQEFQTNLAARKKKKLNKKLLSFADDDGDEEDMPTLKKPKYDVRMVIDIEGERPERQNKPNFTAKAPLPSEPGPVFEEAWTRPEVPSEQQKSKKHLHDVEADSSPWFELEKPEKKSALEKTNEQIAALKEELRQDRPLDRPVGEHQGHKESIADELVPENAIRGRKRKHVSGTGSEARTLGVLNAWMSKLDKAPQTTKPDQGVPSQNSDGDNDAAPGGPGAGRNEEAELCDLHFIANCMSCKSWDKDEKEESDDEGWMSNALTAAADRLEGQLSLRKKAEEELIVIDPREKARSLKEEVRAKRELRSGGNERGWDMARNAKLARASALAGRGAK